MVRRYAVIALVALVLIPSAALAAGFAGGFGPKSLPLGPKTVSPGASDWAGNETAPRWNGTDSAGTGACSGDRICGGARDRVLLRDGACLTEKAGDRVQNRTKLRNLTALSGQACDQDRTRLQDGTRANDPAPPSAGFGRFARQGRHHRALGR